MLAALVATRNVSYIGFSPNYYYSQNDGGLTFYIATGKINGVTYNGQVVPVPRQSTVTAWINQNGMVGIGSNAPPGSYPVAIVTSATVVVGGNTPAGLITPFGKWGGISTADGITSILDIRVR
jgi:hypothetical protein